MLEAYSHLIITLNVKSYYTCLWRHNFKHFLLLISEKLTTLRLFFDKKRLGENKNRVLFF